MSLDIVTPRNVYLSAYFKRSFAFYSIKNREPVILTQLIDTLVRNKQGIVEKLGPASADELKEIIGDISKLKYEIQTNKTIYKLSDTESDVELYNKYIDKVAAQEEGGGRLTHYHTIWLLAECYMYRRLREAFVTRSRFRKFDYFVYHKQEAYNNALPLMRELAKYVLTLAGNNDYGVDSLRQEFSSLVKINLWGNKCDLSLSLGAVAKEQGILDVSDLEKNILAEDCDALFDYIYEESKSNGILLDIVFDNSGYEVFTDLCLAYYLTTKKLVSKIRFHVKSFPWFISDVTLNDFNWTIQQVSQNEDNALSVLGKGWTSEVSIGNWTVHEHDFWTLPHDFTYMSSVAPDLYSLLAQSKLAIFKGDLNYRKLMAEKNWDPVTPFEEALQNFGPTKICALRTVKAHVVCGLKEGVAEELQEKEADWMETGNYGLIQFSTKVVPLPDS